MIKPDHPIGSTMDGPLMRHVLLERAREIVRTCMDIRRGENVLIICDLSTADIGHALHEAALECSERVLTMTMPCGDHHGQEPPTPVASLMRQQQVIIAPTLRSLTHTRAARSAIREGARIATMPGVTEDIFLEGGLSTDFAELKATIASVGHRLRRKRMVHVTTPSGTDLRFEVAWKDWNLDDHGICNRPRMITNLPAGKIFTMPREGTMDGRIVLDGSWDASLISDHVVMSVESGRVTRIEGGDLSDLIRADYDAAASRLDERLKPWVWTVSEFGFGLNPHARLVGNVLEDEKCLGTCYIAIGDNTRLGGSAAVGISNSGVMRQPTVRVDDVEILIDGVRVNP